MKVSILKRCIANGEWKDIGQIIDCTMIEAERLELAGHGEAVEEDDDNYSSED